MSTADCLVCLESFAFPEEAVIFVVCGHCLCAGCWRQREWVRCPTCRMLAADEDKPRPVFGRIFVHISPHAAAATVILPQPLESEAAESDVGNAVGSVNDGVGAGAEEACIALETLADTSHLNSTTRAGIFDIFRTVDRGLRPSLVALLTECAHLAESRATLVACVDQLRARVQVLEGEKRHLASSLHTAQVALRAAEGRTKDRTEENLMLRDALCASANDTNTWMRRAEALESDVHAMKRDIDDRDNAVKLLTEQNRALAEKLAGYGCRTWASRLLDLCLIIFFGLAILFIALFRLALFLVEPFI
ncbi:hypothetical protein GGF50DRAFT_112523 [Schizophyllum commune]